jgi:hypothetical protein
LGGEVAGQLLATFVLGLSAGLPTGTADGAIEDVIDREIPASGVPGVAYAVVAGGETTPVGAWWEYSNVNDQVVRHQAGTGRAADRPRNGTPGRRRRDRR